MRGHVRHRIETLRLRRAIGPLTPTRTIRLGSAYGGWVIPDGLVTADSIVYSAGVGEDVTFDLELIARTGCHVFAFDPTPRAIAFAAGIAEERFHFHPVGLWSSDGPRSFFGPADPNHVSHSILTGTAAGSSFEAECKSPGSLMRELGHERIDLLKLDIEGAELEVLGSLTEPRPRCICAEFHPIRPTREIATFIHSLDYGVAAIEDWNVTLLLPQAVEGRIV